MGNDIVSIEEIKRRQSEATSADIPICSMCQEKPDHVGKIVAGRGNIFLCRDCIKSACDVLRDTGFPLD